MCQVDASQYVSKWDLKSSQVGLEQLGHSPAEENSLGLSMVCLIA